MNYKVTGKTERKQNFFQKKQRQGTKKRTGLPAGPVVVIEDILLLIALLQQLQRHSFTSLHHFG
ncbi:hypothetical protein V9K67_15190, partial [Paraflavisolibacter sp. H34]|uniref:hypothetical protein n=1 Tax=Huijunlia imazamoxiresistens TaxID=3127457 RepID=UPI00301661F7